MSVCPHLRPPVCFSTVTYAEMNEDSFHQMMEGNDWTYFPLFSDKEFLNEDWPKYTHTESCPAIGNARHGCKSLRYSKYQRN